MSEKHNFLAGTIVCVICDENGYIEIHHFDPSRLHDAQAILSLAQAERANWGKLYEVRARDGRYIFHSEFQQRT